MNAVGKIGELIVKYQYPIEIALLSVLGLIIVCLLARAVIKNKKEKDVLAEINSKVSDINDAVNSINNKNRNETKEQTSTSSNNISVMGEKPSVKVSYTVKEDKQDCTTTVHIDHEVLSESAANEKCEDAKLKDNTEQKELDAEESIEDDIVITSKEERVKLPKVDEQTAEITDIENCNLESLIKQITENNDDDEIEHDASDITIELNVPLRVYRTRDCAVDKFGKVYTEKELSEQIK